MDFHSMPRKQLQALCKKNKIPANITTVAMADALKALQVVEGMEEFQDPADSGPQPAQKAEEPKPVVPPPQPTSRRQATRRNAAADSEDSEAPQEPPSSPPQQTPAGRRGARASRAVSKNNPKEAAAESLVVKELDGIPLIEIPDTPATAAAKKKTRRGGKTFAEPKEPEADDEQEEHPVEDEPEEEQLDVLPPPRTGRRGASKAASPAKKKTTRRGAKARAEQEEPEEEQLDLLPPLTPVACAAAPAPRTGRRASTRAASTVKESEQPETQLGPDQQAELPANNRARRATRRTEAFSETETVTTVTSRTRGVRKMVDLLPDPDKQAQEVVPSQEEKEEDAGVSVLSSAEDSDATLQPEVEQPVPNRGRRETRTAVREPAQKQEEPVAKPSNRRRQTSRPPAVEGNVATRRSRSRGVLELEKHEQEVVSTEEEVGGNVRTRRSRSRGVAEPEKHEIVPAEEVAGNVRTRRSRSRGVLKPEKHEEEVAPTEEQVTADPEEASSDSVVTHESVEDEVVVCDLPPPTTGRRRASARASSNVKGSAKQLEMTQALEEQPVPEVRNKRRQSIRPLAASRRSKAKSVQEENEPEIAPIEEEDAGTVATEAEQPADAHPPELVAESENTLEEEVPQIMDTEISVEPVSALSPVAEEEEDIIIEEPPVEELVETKVEETDSAPEQCVPVVFEEQINILPNDQDNDVAADFVWEVADVNADEVPACAMQEECIDVVEDDAGGTVSSPLKILDFVSAPVLEEDADIIDGSELSEQVVSAESSVEVNTLEIEDEQQIPSTQREEEETDAAVAAGDQAVEVQVPHPSTPAAVTAGDQAVEVQVPHPSTPAAVTAQKSSALKMSASVRKSAVSTVRLASGAQRLLLTPEVVEARTEERTAQKSSASRFSTSVKRSAVSVRPEERKVSMMEALVASEEPQVEEELELAVESLDAIVDEASVFCESVVADEPLVDVPLPPAAELEEDIPMNANETEELNASITNQEETTEEDVVVETSVVTVEEYADVMEVDMEADVKEEVEIASAVDFVEQVATGEGVVDAVEIEDAPMEEQKLPSTPIEDEASQVAEDDALVPEVHQAQEPSTPAALSAPLTARKATAARPSASARKSAVSVRLAREVQQSPWTPASVSSSSLTAQKASATRAPPSTSARKSAVSVRLARESQLPPSTPAAAAVSGSLTARKAPAATPSATAKKSAVSVRMGREAQQAISTPAAVSTPLTARKASAASAGKSAFSARLAREVQQLPSTPTAVSASLTSRKASAATPSTTARKSAASLGLARESQLPPSTPAAVSVSLTARKTSAATPSTTARKSAVSFGFERLFLTPAQMEAQSKEKTCDKTRPSARRAVGTGSRSMASRVRTVSKMAAQEPELEQERAAENLNEAAVIEKSLFSELVASEEPLQDPELPAVAEVVEEADSSVIADLKEDIRVVSATADFTDEVDDDGVVIDALEFEDAWEEEQQLPSALNEEEEDIGAALDSLFKTPAYRSRVSAAKPSSSVRRHIAEQVAVEEEDIGAALGSLFKTPAYRSRVSAAKPSSSVPRHITEQVAVEEEDIGAALGSLFKTPAYRSRASAAKPSSSVPRHITEQVAVEEEDIGAALGSLFKTPAVRSKAVDGQEQLFSTPSAASALLTPGKASAARPSAVAFRLAGEAEKLVLTPMSAKAQPGGMTCPSSKAARSMPVSAARAPGLSKIEALPIAEDLELVAAKEELDGAAVQPAAAFLESLENVNETLLLESKEEDACVLEDAATAVDETVIQNDDSAVRDYWGEFVLLKEAEGECFSESHTGNEMAEGSWEAINDADESDEEEEEHSGEDEFFDLSEELGFGGFGSVAPCMFNNSASQAPVWWNADIGEISELSAVAAFRIAREVDEEDALKTEEIERIQQQEVPAPAIQSPAAADAAIVVASPLVASERRRSAATTAKKTKKKTSLTDDKENSMVLLLANATDDNAEEAAAGARDDDGLQQTDNNKQQQQKQPLQEGGKIKKRCVPTQEELMAMSMRQLKKQFAALNLASKQNSGAAITLADAARECPNTAEKKKNNRSVLGRSALCPLSDNLLSPRPKC